MYKNSSPYQLLTALLGLIVCGIAYAAPVINHQAVNSAAVPGLAAPLTTSLLPQPVADLTANQTQVAPGGSVSATFSANLPNGTSDYIALYKASDGDGSYMILKSVASAINRTIVFTAPTTPNDYNFRYLAQTSGNQYYVAARSNTFTVSAAGPLPTPTPTPTATPSPSPTPTPIPAPTPQADLVANPGQVAPGGSVSATFSANLPNGTSDYIALYKASDGDGSYMILKSVASAINRTIVFTAPTTPNDYNFRYLARTSGSQYYVAARSNTFTVGVGGPSPAPTPVSTPTPTPLPTAGPSSQCTWYVATNGSSSGNGSVSSPWALMTVAGGDPAFGGQAPPASIHPGDNICLRGGTYTGFYETILAGTSGHQITIMAYPGERVVIDSAAGTPNVPNTAKAGIQVGSVGNQFGYVTLRDLEITDSYSANRQDARPDGVYIAAPGVWVINNIIHDTGNGIFHNTDSNDSIIYGNIIYNVGWDDRLNGLFQGGTGHGLYASNSSGFLRVYNNIIAASLGYGFHFYSAGTGDLKNIDVQDNVSLNNGYWTRYHDSWYASEGRATDNFMMGNRPITALNFARNIGYHREGRGAQNLELGYNGNENISGTANGNSFIGGVNTIDHFETVTFTNNYISTGVQVLSYVAPNTNVSTTINNNTYYFYPNSATSKDCSFQPFALTVNNNQASIASWKAQGFDTASTINACGVRDSTPTVTIRANAYDARRFNVTVNNPTSSSTVTLNLSSALANGTLFELRNAQDYFGPPVASGTYNGPISINMTTLNVAVPIGYASLPNTTPLAQMTSGPQFGAFILIKK